MIMKIALINPKSDSTIGNGFLKRLTTIYRTTFPVLAAYIPDHVEVTVFDENVEKIDFEEPVDLVGISVLTSAFQRACEITQRYHSLNIPVVWGGIHPTVRPIESKNHADAIVRGYGELAIQRVIEDFNNGKISREYCEPLPKPRRIPNRNVMRAKSWYVFDTIETSRGCPNTCDYCSIPILHGKTVTFFSIDSVIEDIQSTEGKYIFFVDDNLIANPAYAKQLFARMKWLGKKWLSQAPIYIAEDEELLRLASESGCIGLYLGLESISPESLIEINKTRSKVDEYPDLIKRIHSFGIGVEAGFIFGFDNDDEFIFDKTLDFIDGVEIDSVNFHILTPYPGTRLFQRLDSEGRLLHKNWEKYTTGNVVFQPKRMSVQRLQEGYDSLWRAAHSFKRVINRTLGSNHPFSTLVVNLAYKGKTYFR